MKYKHIALGGTFDRLHLGHVALLDAAFKNSKNISIGITTKVLHEKILPKSIQSYKDREQSLTTYIKNHYSGVRVTFVPLEDIYGTTLTDRTIDALIITTETKKNALLINKQRLKKGLLKLPLFIVPLIKGPDKKIISSSRIRLGDIDRYGNSYSSLFKKNITISDSVKKKLKSPFGILFRGNEEDYTIAARKTIHYLHMKKPVMVIGVGDIVTNSLHELNYPLDTSIIDFKSHRKYILPKEEHSIFDIENKAGTINKAFITFFQKRRNIFVQTSKKNSITVQGEEDLLAIPVMLLAPLGAIVLYGQPSQGIVAVEITEELKDSLIGNILSVTIKPHNE